MFTKKTLHGMRPTERALAEQINALELTIRRLKRVLQRVQVDESDCDDPGYTPEEREKNVIDWIGVVTGTEDLCCYTDSHGDSLGGHGGEPCPC